MKKIITTTLALLAPAIAFAQSAPITNVNSLATRLNNIGNLVIGILIALAVIYIIFHIFMFIKDAGDADKRKEHQSGILWGIVGLAVILSIWGLVRILTGTFGTDTRAPIENYPVNPNPPPVI